MARTYQFKVGSAEKGCRLDLYLVKHLPTSLSRAIIQRSIRQGLVIVNEKTVSSNHKLCSGDQVLAHFEQLPAPPMDREMLPENIPLEIVYEDAHLLVVNKPPGLVVHPAPGHWTGTLVNAILWHLQKNKSRQNSEFGIRNSESREQDISHSTLHTPHLERAGIVHRLDKDTSGLLLIAKAALVHTALSKQLKVRRIKRSYVALIEGHPAFDNGTVDAAIGRHTKNRKEMTVRHLGGRMAVTHYRVLKRLTVEIMSLSQNSEFGIRNSEWKSKTRDPKPETRNFVYSLLEVSLETGRTHQIRVHMAHLGHPILGDTTYGKRAPSFWQQLGINRQLLHAQQLSFEHPVTKQQIKLSAPPPEDIARFASAKA